MTDRLATSQLAQPPTFDLDMYDGDQMVGWLSPDSLGFRGFESETEAMPAAFLAHRTLSRRLAHRDGRRPIPIGVEPLRLKHDDTIDAAGRRIATIVRPGSGSKTGPDSFGFELAFATRVDEVTARAKFAHLYWTLRRSGIRWAMWRARRLASRTRLAPPVAAAKPEPFTPAAPWWFGTIGLSSVLLMLVALLGSGDAAPLLAGAALAGLFGLRFFAMTTGWPGRSVRPAYTARQLERRR